MKSLLLAVVFACVGVVKADTFYWQVDTNADDAWHSGLEFTLANLVAEGEGGKHELTSVVVDGYDGSAVTSGTSIKPIITDLGDYGTPAYSFYVELCNASGDVLQSNYAVSYNDLVSSGYVSTAGLTMPTAFMTGAYNGAQVPEPSGGLLLLVGGSMLMLRRRRN